MLDKQISSYAYMAVHSESAGHGSSLDALLHTSIRLLCRRLGFHPHAQHHSFMEIGHEINFYGHSLPSTDSRNAKECALVLVNCLGGLPRNSVDRLTDHARNMSKGHKTPIQQHSESVLMVVLYDPGNKFEPRHDKTNKMTVCPAKIQISLGIHPV